MFTQRKYAYTTLCVNQSASIIGLFLKGPISSFLKTASTDYWTLDERTVSSE